MQLRTVIFALIVLVGAHSFTLNIADSADDNSEKIDNTRAALEQWVETQRVLSKEKSDLALAKEMLKERIVLVKREIDQQRAKIKEAEASIAEADGKRTEMIEENDKFKQATSLLGNTLIKLEDRTKQMIQRLPEPIRVRIKPLSQRLTDTKEESKLSVSERFQNVVGILNEVDKFNRDISVNSEVHELADGTSAEVSALYLGVGQSYYVGSNGAIGGVGTASDQGWIWKPSNQAASQIAQAIAILKNEQAASFVLLPVEIQTNKGP